MDCIAIQSLGHDTALGRGVGRVARRAGCEARAWQQASLKHQFLQTSLKFYFMNYRFEICPRTMVVQIGFLLKSIFHHLIFTASFEDRGLDNYF